MAMSLCTQFRCVTYNFVIVVKGKFWKFHYIAQSLAIPTCITARAWRTYRDPCRVFHPCLIQPVRLMVQSAATTASCISRSSMAFLKPCSSLALIIQACTTHAHAHINDFRGVHATYVKCIGKISSETHRLKVNGHCDTTLFIPVCYITLAHHGDRLLQPKRPLHNKYV